MSNIYIKKILLLIFFMGLNTTVAQSIKNIIPNSAKAGSNLIVVVIGSNTHWQKSPDTKVEIYFTIPDIVNPTVSILNDTTARVKFYIAENAKIGVRELNLKYSNLNETEYIIIDSSFTVLDNKKVPVQD